MGEKELKDKIPKLEDALKREKLAKYAWMNKADFMRTLWKAERKGAEEFKREVVFCQSMGFWKRLWFLLRGRRALEVWLFRMGEALKKLNGPSAIDIGDKENNEKET